MQVKYLAQGYNDLPRNRTWDLLGTHRQSMKISTDW
uniref:Uncharacterized protein n=1 Tax=Anguilla anguilla TaxID=7936 RepID=A0A0E9U0S2_ANGAN